MKPSSACLFVFVIVACLTVSRLAAEQRTWTDATGNFTIEAEFAGLDDGVVRLKKNDGTIVEVPVGKLSGDDRLWVARNRRKSATASDLGSDVQLVSAEQWPRWRGPTCHGRSR